MSSQDTDRQDEQNIPLLKDVVDPSQIDSSDHYRSISSEEFPNSAEILLDIRRKIAAQLKQDLQPLISSASHSAVEQASEAIRQIMLDEFQRSLRNQIHMLIEELLDKQFEKPYSD